MFFKLKSSNIQKIREKSISDYYHNMLYYTIKSNYVVNTTNLKPRKRIIRYHQRSNGDEKSEFRSRFYSYELETTIRLKSLDDSISWSLDTCWLDETTCLNQMEQTNYLIPKNKKEDNFEFGLDDFDYDKTASQDNHQYNYDEEEEILYENESENDYSRHIPEHYSNSTEYSNFNSTINERKISNSRKERMQNMHHLNVINYRVNIFKSEINYDHKNKIFTHEINLKLSLSDFSNYNNNKKFILCNLRPYPTCNRSLQNQIYDELDLKEYSIVRIVLVIFLIEFYFNLVLVCFNTLCLF